MIFESHAHYDDEAFDEDREALLSSLQENGIEYVINVGASLKSTASTVELTKRYPFIYGAAGVHPSETAELNEENFSWLVEQCKQPKIVAVGEIGLDYYWEEPEHEIQKNWFEKQLENLQEGSRSQSLFIPEKQQRILTTSCARTRQKKLEALCIVILIVRKWRRTM